MSTTPCLIVVEGLIAKSIKILKSGGSLLGQTLIKVEPDKVKWVVKLSKNGI